ncbi:MAG: glycosyltransferase family 4 protein [Planctomycetes bacterium]|nr:glycosyltransferase family 4 protein [Planctomycetota bacterium]
MTSREPITVLHARIVSGTGGGPEKTILNSPRHLVGTRYRALAAYLHAPGDAGIEILRERAAARECPFTALADAWPIDIGTLRALAELCRRENVRIWHGHDYKSNLYGILLAKLVDVRLVTTMHGWVKHTSRTPFYFAVDRWCLRRYEQVAAVSRDLFDAALAAGVAPERVVQIDNAIDTREFVRRAPANTSALRRAHPERLVIGAVGRLSNEKGFDILIEAVERCLVHGLDLELWIAGEGDQQQHLEARMRASKYHDRLRLLGFQKDTLALFEAFDVFALSSLREGLPNVVLEAMAMDVPVVATRCGGLSAFGRDEQDMLLVDVNSVAALERGIACLARDPELRTRLAHAARARIERELSFTARMQKMVALYDRLELT